jgi:cellulose synthase/poly-beta-1,6-N-acetylglucosamine synthase-like glycosyltransferase
MNWAGALLTGSALAVLYTWVGYPLALWLLRGARTKETLPADGSLTFSIVIAAHNEGAQMTAKLDDCLALDYPRDRMEILVVSDGSTDSTDDVVQSYAASDARVRLMRTPGRAGKSGAQNLAAKNVAGDILLFTDAGARLRPDSLQRIASRFADARVGLVAPVVCFGRHANAVSRGQGAYWRFELWLRQLESGLGILATASGAAFAIRKNLFREIAPHFGDDCVLPLDVCLQNAQVVQEPQAIVFDEMPHTVGGELRTRARMTARSCGGTLSRRQLLNPFRFPAMSWGLLSHKILRWMTPFFLLTAFFANAALATRTPLLVSFALQCCFYAIAIAGWRGSGIGGRGRVLGYPFAFCLANLGFLLGTMRCMRGTRVVAYK